MSNFEIFLTVFFDHCATYLHSENTVRSITKLDQVEHLGLYKKAAVISNFCLIGKIHHNFLVLRMIELACKTFMPIQILDLHRVQGICSPWMHLFSLLFWDKRLFHKDILKLSDL